jgi:hypothetical protein
MNENVPFEPASDIKKKVPPSGESSALLSANKMT